MDRGPWTGGLVSLDLDSINCRWVAIPFVIHWGVLNGEKEKDGNWFVSGKMESERNILLFRKCLFRVGTGSGTEPRERKRKPSYG